MKILIIDCLTGENGKRNFSRDFIGAGPRYVAGYIESVSEGEIKTYLIRGEEFLKKDRSFINTYPIIAISAMTMDFLITRLVLERWKTFHIKDYRRFSIIGGPIVNDLNIDNKIDFDLAIRYESEISLTMLFKRNLKLFKNIRNKTDNLWKDELFHNLENNSQLFLKNKIIEPNYSVISSEINSIFRDSTGYPEKILGYKRYKFARVYVELVRGCSNFRRTSLQLKGLEHCDVNVCNVCRKEDFNTKEYCPQLIPPGCGFCSTINSFGSVKSRKIENVINEIKKLIDMGCCRIVLGAPDFLDYYREENAQQKLISPKKPEPNYKRIEQLITGLINIDKIKNGDVQIFIENIKASLCTEAALKELLKIPQCIFSIGCETGSSKFAEILGRPSAPNEIYNVIRKSKNYGIRNHVYFIHSLPGDTVEYAKETFSFLKKISLLNIDKITLYRYSKFPGSPFYNVKSKYEKFNEDYKKIISKIKKFCIEYNKEMKKKLVGKTLKVIVSEANFNYKNDAIGWLLEGGPKVNVVNGKKYLGKIVKVKINNIFSDKLISGNIIY